MRVGLESQSKVYLVGGTSRGKLERILISSWTDLSTCVQLSGLKRLYQSSQHTPTLTQRTHILRALQ